MCGKPGKGTGAQEETEDYLSNILDGQSQIPLKCKWLGFSISLHIQKNGRIFTKYLFGGVDLKYLLGHRVKQSLRPRPGAGSASGGGRATVIRGGNSSAPGPRVTSTLSPGKTWRATAPSPAARLSR